MPRHGGELDVCWFPVREGQRNDQLGNLKPYLLFSHDIVPFRQVREILQCNSHLLSAEHPVRPESLCNVAASESSGGDIASQKAALL